MTVAAPHRRPDGEEHEVGFADRWRKFGREADPPHAQIALEQFFEPRLVDRHVALAELLDPTGIFVDASDLPTEFREAGCRDQADIARPNHANVHETYP